MNHSHRKPSNQGYIGRRTSKSELAEDWSVWGADFVRGATSGSDESRPGASLQSLNASRLDRY